MRERRKELAELKLKAQLVQKLIKICKKGFPKRKKIVAFTYDQLKNSYTGLYAKFGNVFCD